MVTAYLLTRVEIILKKNYSSSTAISLLSTNKSPKVEELLLRQLRIKNIKISNIL